MITLVQRNKNKRNFTWYARVPDPHKKTAAGATVYHYFSLGTSSKSDAKLLMIQKMKAGEFDLKDEAQTLTLGKGIEKFEAHARARGVKSGSIETMYQAFNMLTPLFEKLVAEITAPMITEAFLNAAESISPMTYRNRKTILSTLFNYFADVLEVIPRNVIRKAIPRRKIPKKKRDFWTTEQIDRIIAAAPTAKSRFVWSLMAFAGLRRNEAIHIKPSDIHDGRIYVIGKGDKPASIPICPRLQREIDRYIRDDNSWKLSFGRKQLNRVAALAIPEGFNGPAFAHRFRHSFGSNMIRAGVSIKIVQELMRHETITLTLDTYGHILDTDVEKAINEVYK